MIISVPIRPLAALSVALTCAGCTSTKDPYTREDKISNTVKYGVIGTTVGAALGAVSNAIGGGNIAKGAIGGGFSGGVQGVIAGAAMDRLEAGLLAEFEATGVKVSPRGENLVLEIGDGIHFDQNSSIPDTAAARKLRAVGLILARFQRNRIDVVGHVSADETTSLSGLRAMAVRRLLAQQGVSPRRMRGIGKGATEPLRSDASEVTRTINRRVDILIAPLT